MPLNLALFAVFARVRHGARVPTLSTDALFLRRTIGVLIALDFCQSDSITLVDGTNVGKQQ